MIYLAPIGLELPGGRPAHYLSAGLVDDAGGDQVTAWDELGDGLLDTDPAGVWEWVTRWTRDRGETRVWLHGLEQGLGLTRARHHLTRLGWRVDGFAMREHSGWWRWRKGERLLVLCDAASFLGNASLDAIAKDLGAEVSLSSPDTALDGRLALLEARGRVWVLRSALRRVWGFYELEDFGSLQLTGSSQGMGVYRRRFLPDRAILVHHEEEARLAERDATWAGRCEGWRWGRVGGPLEEWDYELCYPSLCSAPVPAILTAHPVPGGTYTTLNRCRVTVRDPVVPMAGGDRGVIFPVGTFETVLWEPELELAREHGSVIVEERWVYELDGVLADWSEWIRDLALHHPSGLVRRIAKQWSRTVIGSFGLRYQSWEEWSSEVGLEVGPDDIAVVPYRGDDGDTQLLYLAGDVFELGEEQDSENAVPQIQGYVWSRARVALWQAITAAGRENVVYVDTDSLIVTGEGGRRLEEWAEDSWPRLRRKARYDWIEVYGSRQLITPEGVRISGLKRGAERTGESSWEVTVEETMPGALGGAEGGRVRRRRFTLGRGELRRERLSEGLTGAIRA
jgi:hypothetical protein